MEVLVSRRANPYDVSTDMLQVAYDHALKASRTKPIPGEQGVQGPPGNTGKGLDFMWDGTRLGVKVEGSEEYVYRDLALTAYTHVQMTALTVWVVNHNLGRHPSVTVVDSGNTVVIGDITYVDPDILFISFSHEFTGTAYLN